MNFIRRFNLLGALLTTLFALSASAASELRVAAAADLKFALAELSAEFEKSTGTKVETTFGSSGNFFSQLQNGAPFDVFLSADIGYTQKLDAAGLAESGTLFSYAVGRLVLWFPPDSKLDVANSGWESLLDPSIQKIAIANPEHAPYGRAAVAALRSAGIYDQVKDKLVLGENISQAAQFVQSGNAQAGILALSLTISPAMLSGKSWNIPAQQYPPILQGAIALKNSTRKNDAVHFLNFLKTPPARKIFEKYGFAIPASTPSEAKSE